MIATRQRQFPDCPSHVKKSGNTTGGVFIMVRMIDLTGQRFGRLSVVKRTENNIHGHVRWLCKCDCGNEKIVLTSTLRRKSGTKSCGCLLRELTTERNATHGMGKSRPYRIWTHMKARCLYPNDQAYKDYGGRGIKLCEKWLTFEGFWEDMQEGYKDTLTIDRKDNNQGYYKENCRWATPKEQSLNKRSNIILTYNSKTQTVSEWAKELNIDRRLIERRLKRGWKPEDALMVPKIRENRYIYGFNYRKTQ